MLKKVHVTLDWSLVYPELGYMKDPDEKTSSKSPVQQLDNMLDKANVDQALIMRLGDNLRDFNATVVEFKIVKSSVTMESHPTLLISVNVASTSQRTVLKIKE